MNLKRKTQLDKEAIEKFRKKEKQPLTLPASIKEEYKVPDDEGKPGEEPKRRQMIKVVVDKGPPLQQYTDAMGYPFSRGHILERRMAQFVIWDFCLTHLLARYHRVGLRLRDLQERVFRFLEGAVEYTSREPVMAVGLVEGWAIYPGSPVAAFTLVIHFASEDEAREWTANTLIEKVLPKAISKAREYADQKAERSRG